MVFPSVAVIRRHIRAEEVFCRIEGDEFLVILGGFKKSRADIFCNEINIELLRRETTLKLPYTMTINCGTSILNLEHPQFADSPCCCQKQSIICS